MSAMMIECKSRNCSFWYEHIKQNEKEMQAFIVPENFNMI